MNRFHERLETLNKKAEEMDANLFTIQIINEFYVDTVEDIVAPTANEVAYSVWYVDNIIAIFNPKLKKDISLLKELGTIMFEYQKSLGFVDDVLDNVMPL